MSSLADNEESKKEVKGQKQNGKNKKSEIKEEEEDEDEFVKYL